MFFWSSLAVLLFALILGRLAFHLFMKDSVPNYDSPAVRAFRATTSRTVWVYVLLWALAILCAFWVVLLLNRVVFGSFANFKVSRTDWLIAWGVLAAGLGATKIKRRVRRLYGWFEVGFAWFSAVAVSAHLDKSHLDITAIIALGAIVFVCSRGADNIAIGVAESESNLKKLADETRAEIEAIDKSIFPAELYEEWCRIAPSEGSNRESPGFYYMRQGRKLLVAGKKNEAFGLIEVGVKLDHLALEAFSVWLANPFTEESNGLIDDPDVQAFVVKVYGSEYVELIKHFKNRDRGAEQTSDGVRAAESDQRA